MADTLSEKSRDFYERAKMKQVHSLFFAGIGLVFFGMACEDGGQSNAATIMKDSSLTSGDSEDAVDALSSGFGMGCFLKLIGCVLAFSASIYCSSFFCGTLNEKKIIRNCFELEDNSSSERSQYVEEEAPTPSPVDKSGAV